MPSEDLGVISTSLFRFMGPFGAHWETFPQRFICNGFMRGATKWTT